jgi:hypothetical protein
MTCICAPSLPQRTLAITLLYDSTYRSFATVIEYIELFHFFATCERAVSGALGAAIQHHQPQHVATHTPHQHCSTHAHTTTTTTTTGLVWTRAFGECSTVHTAKDEVWQCHNNPTGCAFIHALHLPTECCHSPPHPSLPHPFLPSLPRSFRPFQPSRLQQPRSAPIVAANRAGTTSVVKGGCCTARSPTSGSRAYTRPVQLVPQRHLKPPTTHGSPGACTCACACTCGQDCRGARGGGEPAC